MDRSPSKAVAASFVHLLNEQVGNYCRAMRAQWSQGEAQMPGAAGGLASWCHDADGRGGSRTSRTASRLRGANGKNGKQGKPWRLGGSMRGGEAARRGGAKHQPSSASHRTSVPATRRVAGEGSAAVGSAEGSAGRSPAFHPPSMPLSHASSVDEERAATLLQAAVRGWCAGGANMT